MCLLVWMIWTGFDLIVTIVAFALLILHKLSLSQAAGAEAGLNINLPEGSNEEAWFTVTYFAVNAVVRFLIIGKKKRLSSYLVPFQNIPKLTFWAVEHNHAMTKSNL
jgi:hypothetical protein